MKNTRTVSRHLNQGAVELQSWQRRSGRTQLECAALLGVHVSTMCQWLSGAKTPGLSKAVIIEARTGITPRSWTVISDGELGKLASAVR